MADKQPSKLQKLIKQRLNVPNSDEAAASHICGTSKFVLPALKCGSLANMQSFEMPNMHACTTEEMPPKSECHKTSEMRIDLRQALNSCHALKPNADATCKSELQQAKLSASTVQSDSPKHASQHAGEAARPDDVLPCTLDASQKVYRIKLKQPSALGRLLCETQRQVPPVAAAKNGPSVGFVGTHVVKAFRFDTLSPDEQNLLNLREGELKQHKC